MATVKKSDQQRLEEIQALGFEDEADYRKHQEMLDRADELRISQHLIEASGPWCVL